MKKIYFRTYNGLDRIETGKLVVFEVILDLKVFFNENLHYLRGGKSFIQWVLIKRSTIN